MHLTHRAASPQAVLNSSKNDMEWYYAKHGKQEGPVDLATIQGKVQSGEIAPTDLVWKEGMPEWKPAGEVPDLRSAPQTSVGPVAQTPVIQSPVVGAPAGQAVTGRSATMAPVAHQHIPNYLVPAILVTIFCCWPFGIPAIVFAAKVDGMVSRGDIAGAQHASEQAKMWCWVSGGIGFAVLAIYIGLMVFAGIQG